MLAWSFMEPGSHGFDNAVCSPLRLQRFPRAAIRERNAKAAATEGCASMHQGKEAYHLARRLWWHKPKTTANLEPKWFERPCEATPETLGVEVDTIWHEANGKWREKENLLRWEDTSETLSNLLQGFRWTGGLVGQGVASAVVACSCFCHCSQTVLSRLLTPVETQWLTDKGA